MTRRSLRAPEAHQRQLQPPVDADCRRRPDTCRNSLRHTRAACTTPHNPRTAPQPWQEARKPPLPAGTECPRSPFEAQHLHAKACRSCNPDEFQAGRSVRFSQSRATLSNPGSERIGQKSPMLLGRASSSISKNRSASPLSSARDSNNCFRLAKREARRPFLVNIAVVSSVIYTSPSLCSAFYGALENVV